MVTSRVSSNLAWSETGYRCQSLLMQGQRNPLQTVAAYIDLNPVRGGLVEDLKDYRWSSFAITD